MKKLTMKDFRWLVIPHQWNRSYKDLSLKVDNNLCLPEAPLFLAVSDDDFTFTAKTTKAPEQGMCGLCIYHTEGSYTAVGCSGSNITVESSVRSYKSTVQVPHLWAEESITWILARTGEQARLGYVHPEHGKPVWVCTTTLPGMAQAVSFGLCFSNTGNTSFMAQAENLRYTKNISQEHHPLV